LGGEMPDLVAVIVAWPNLSDDVRRGIVAMVKASAGRDDGERGDLRAVTCGHVRRAASVDGHGTRRADACP